MASRETSTASPQVKTAIGVTASVALLIPIALALQFARTESVPGAVLLLGGVIWMAAFVIHHWLIRREKLLRRRALNRELRDVRNARLANNTTFRNRLISQQVILDRVLAISDEVLEEGIIDPRSTLNSVRLIRAHVREAHDSIEDAVIESDVNLGSHEPEMVTINARDEIEKVVAPFALAGLNIATGGPRHFVVTDPATYRVIVRGLINAALSRHADDIDVSLARDGELIVCTVSDDGDPETADAIPTMIRTLTATLDGESRFSRALGRNQFSLAVPAGVQPDDYTAGADPMDVLGGVPTTTAPVESKTSRGNRLHAGEGIRFVSAEERDEKQSVAAKRRSRLLAR